MGLLERLRKQALIKDINEPGGRVDPRFHPSSIEIPTKQVANTRQNMDLLRLYTHGLLKYENTGRTCGNCVNFYPDSLSRLGGRCRARGFIEVHQDTPADERSDYTDPISGLWFRYWPSCPLFTLKERLSRR